MVDGALAGLSLLQDEPNFRHSLPTKVVEYMARGVPVITTPLPAAAELARSHECGFVVPFGDARAAAEAVLELDRDASLRAKMGQRGHAAAYSSWAGLLMPGNLSPSWNPGPRKNHLRTSSE